MRYVLDTHTSLWYAWADPQLPQTVAELIDDEHNLIFISVVSLWEIAIKSSNGKLDLGLPITDFFQENIYENGFQLLPVTQSHVVAVHALPFHHRDPFDRLLVAQALTGRMTFLSADVAMDAYGVSRTWN